MVFGDNENNVRFAFCEKASVGARYDPSQNYPSYVQLLVYCIVIRIEARKIAKEAIFQRGFVPIPTLWAISFGSDISSCHSILFDLP